ncbi:MAG: DNA-binding protein [Planctomycetota bacterium]|nr:DNA-binding protein [Planctomycetota bacterium]
MTTFTVQLEDTKADALREKALRYGLRPEQFLTASVEELIGQPEPDFEQAARRVLSKNQELYRRLA